MWGRAQGLQRVGNIYLHETVFRLIERRSLNSFFHSSQRKLWPKSVQSDKFEFPSTYSDINVPKGVTLSQFLFDKQEEFADRTALVNGETGQSFTNQEIRSLSLSFGSALSKLGYCSGDVLGVISPNCPEFAICILGMISSGIIPTTISSSFVADEIKTQLKNSGSVGIICHEENLPVIRSACEGNSDIRHIILIGTEQDGVISFRRLLKENEMAFPNHSEIIPEEDVAILPFSSGTTGIPKGVMLTHRNMVANVSQISHPDVMFIGRDNDIQDILIGVLPLYHIYGLAILFLSLYNGGQIVTLKKFDQYTYSKTIKKYKPTILPVVPPLMTFMGNNSIMKPLDLVSVRIVLCGAAPLGPSVVERFTSKFGSHMDILEGYGMTEASPVTHITPLKTYLGRASSGLVTAPNTYSKIVDTETKVPLPPNQEGELCVKGPQVMKGYLKNEEATRNTIQNGWLHTGDIARMDENQNLSIVDRLKELIKVKGLQVAPAELENLLRLHPYVDDVAVIGIPDERAGELPRAFVVTQNDRNITEEELKEFVARRVAPHKQISSVVFIEEIPKSAAGKILRKNLRNI